MSREQSEVQDASDERLSNAYLESVGAVLTARKLFDRACADHATQAQEYLAREVSHRNDLRQQYDRVLYQI